MNLVSTNFERLFSYLIADRFRAGKKTIPDRASVHK